MVMRVFKKFLKMTAFLLILCILLSGISWVVSPKDNQSMHNSYANGFLGEKTNTIDILIIGDSESYASFSPMQIWRDYGYTTYVCGTSRQYIQDSYDFLTRFTQSQKPKVVILEANLLYRSEGRFSDIFRSMQNAASKFMPVFEYHNRWKKLGVGDFKKSKGYTWRDELKGFRFNSKIVPYEGSAEYMVHTDKVKRIPDMSTHYFNKIAEHCKQNNIQLVLMNTASPVNWSYEKHNGVEKLAKEYGIKYLDMNLLTKELKIDWKKDTYDKGDHLNFYGAQKVTGYLGEYLKNNFEITDHRGKEEYKHWNDDLKAYEKNSAKI